MENQRSLEARLKDLMAKHESDQRQLKEFQLKQLKKKGGVFVEEEDEVNM